jgi:heme oxygenase
MILDQLRKETKYAHAALEKQIIPKIKNATPASYSGLLACFYGYYKPVEDKIDLFISNDIVPHYSERRKAATIIHDLGIINGAAVYELPLCNHLPDINDVATALGAMYVLEGSTLGGSIIVKMLMQRLELHDESAVQFFSGYGEKSGAMWASFIRVLDNYTADKPIQQQIAATASATFSLFNDWIVRNELHIR